MWLLANRGLLAWQRGGACQANKPIDTEGPGGRPRLVVCNQTEFGCRSQAASSPFGPITDFLSYYQYLGAGLIRSDTYSIPRPAYSGQLSSLPCIHRLVLHRLLAVFAEFSLLNAEPILPPLYTRPFALRAKYRRGDAAEKAIKGMRGLPWAVSERQLA